MIDHHWSTDAPPRVVSCLFALGFTFGCAGPPIAAPADEVVESPGASGDGFGDPGRAVNGVRGGGLDAQSLDVYSIPPSEHLTLGWNGREVLDGPGDDLAVFENPFRYGDGRVFMDPVVVEVSVDGLEWLAFPHDYVAEDESVYSPLSADWVGFAGCTPVSLDVDAEEPLDAFGPDAGGDRFDLADVGLSAIRYVRLTAASARQNPDTGAPFVRDPVSDGADIDGVYARDVSP